jgi:hypothetical protein
MRARELLPEHVLRCSSQLQAPSGSLPCGFPSVTFWLLEWKSSVFESPVFNVVGRCVSHPVQILGDLRGDGDPSQDDLRARELTAEEVLVHSMMSR